MHLRKLQASAVIHVTGHAQPRPGTGGCSMYSTSPGPQARPLLVRQRSPGPPVCAQQQGGVTGTSVLGGRYRTWAYSTRAALLAYSTRAALPLLSGPPSTHVRTKAAWHSCCAHSPLPRHRVHRIRRNVRPFQYLVAAVKGWCLQQNEARYKRGAAGAQATCCCKCT
jgi:hypothetical protein